MKCAVLVFIILVLTGGIAPGVCDSEDILVSKQLIKAQSFEPGNDNPDIKLRQGREETYTNTSGTIKAYSNSSCPSWVTAIDREGSDGGHLTVQIDSCQVFEYIVYNCPQFGGTGYVADLEPDDVFIEWDEDPCHGNIGFFSFSGEYVQETPSYIQVTGSDITNWTVHKVTSNGTLAITDDGYNEHDAIHFIFSPAKLTKVSDINEGNCVGLSDEITYTICYTYPNDLNLPDIYDINIVDYLPVGADYNSSDPCGFYDPCSHTVIWNIGTVSAGDANCVSVTVEINGCILECGIITNTCGIKDGDLTLDSAHENTPVCCASNPSPTCEATVDLYINGLKLTWCQGFSAADTDGHDVYFSTNYNSILNATDDDVTGIFRGNQTATEYHLSDLEFNTTYYWRIDEVNNAHPDQNWPGSVWSFTVGSWSYFVIDDFEDYLYSHPEGSGVCPYYAEEDMRYVWNDGHVQKNPQGDCGSDLEDYNPMALEGSIGRLPGSRILRTNENGGRSGYGISYYYDNNDVTNSEFPPEDDCYEDRYSEILRWYPDGIDFTADGQAVSLELSFKGDTDNSCDEVYDRMYVVLEDTQGDNAQINHDDPDAAQVTDWTQWKIKLSDFIEINPDINFDNIRSIRIGFGQRFHKYDEEPPGGEGTVIFDDIRLYPQCVLSPPIGDFTGEEGVPDCVVNFMDYAVMADEWLKSNDIQTDLYKDGIINIEDLAILVAHWLEDTSWP